VIRQAQVGDTLRLGNLATRRDYVYTDDVARALVLLADAALSGERLVCNVGTGETHTGEEIVSIVGRLLGRPLTPSTDSSRTRPSDRPTLCADASRAEQLLGWLPRVSFENGLMAALEEPVGPGVTWR
jgi:UDP-glucose 4-epimerase